MLKKGAVDNPLDTKMCMTARNLNRREILQFQLVLTEEFIDRVEHTLSITAQECLQQSGSQHP